MKTKENSFKAKVLKAGSWVLLGHAFSQFVRLGGNLILTRLLVPEMFGLMAVVTVFLTGITMFSDLGITQNIIQSKKSGDKKYLNTAWSIQVLRGVVIFFLMLSISWLVYYSNTLGFFSAQSVYADPLLPVLLAVMSIAGLISGFNSLNLAVHNRELELKNIVLVELISQVLGLVFMIALALYYKNIWSLVFGTLLSFFIKVVLSHHRAFGDKAKFMWDATAAREIFHFGKWIFGSSIFTFFAGRGDRILLGGLISPAELGVYSIAFFLATAFKEIVRKVMSSVFYPALSEVARTRPNDLQEVYYRIRKKLDTAVMVVVGLMASCGNLVITFLYDERYVQAGWMLEILSLSTLFLGTTMAGVCLMALGNTKSIMFITATSTVFLFISVPTAFYFWSLDGAVIVIALNALVEIPIIFYMMRRYQLLNWFYEFRMWPLFFITYALGHYGSEWLLAL
jgi:O-antigen/teichoic acid export membrane protein